jgi:hypothetical protein
MSVAAGHLNSGMWNAYLALMTAKRRDSSSLVWLQIVQHCRQGLVLVQVANAGIVFSLHSHETRWIILHSVLIPEPIRQLQQS